MNRMSFIFFLCGVLFGLGLAVSDMTNPMKVKAFLDITGNWDPSLIFVMISSIVVTFVFLNFIPLKSKNSKIISEIRSNVIDLRLIIGAIIFGVGWGLVGFCPGPSIAALADIQINSIYFVISMIVGILIYRFLYKKL